MDQTLGRHLLYSPNPGCISLQLHNRAFQKPGLSSEPVHIYWHSSINPQKSDRECCPSRTVIQGPISISRSIVFGIGIRLQEHHRRHVNLFLILGVLF